MAKLYKVQADWFKKKDHLNHVISSWCKKVSDTEASCIICDTVINCEKKGYAAITQHVKTKIHEANASLKLSVNQLLLLPRSSGTSVCITRSDAVQEQASTSSASTSSQPVSIYHSQEDCVRAELIWAMKSVKSNIAPAACEDLKDIFMAMFPKAVPEKFSLGPTKLSYLITEALGPYFFNNMLEDAKNSYYSLLYDETTNNSNHKELQVGIRYWSTKDNEVSFHHLKTVFMGHATAVEVADQLKTIINLNGLTFKNLIMLGSDGPNVNKKVFRLMDKIVEEERGSRLLHIGFCNLHVVHNSYLKGLSKFGDVGKELIIHIFHFFKKFPSRWDDFSVIQLKEKCDTRRFMKHTSTRWLTLGPAAERLLSQWPAVIEYFLKFIPSKQSHLVTTEKFKIISKYLKYPDIKVELQFLVESSELFTPFLILFQTSAPLVHCLYSEMKLLVKKLAGRICKKDVNIHELILEKDLLPIDKVYCGKEIEDMLAVLNDSRRKATKHNMQQHYFAALTYLKKKVFGSTILKNLQCLQPSQVNKEKSVKYVCNLAKAFSFMDIDDMKVRDEWLILQADTSFKENETDKPKRIDHIWKNVFEKKTSLGAPKYPQITLLAKACLTLSHGNSDVERGFSISQRVLSEEKTSMSQKMLNARLNVRDGLKKFESIAKIPITKHLLNMAFDASKSYSRYLEDQRKIKILKEIEDKAKEEEKLKLEQQRQELLGKKESISALETKVKLLSEEKKTTQDTADVLLKEGNERLKKALAENNLAEIHVSQTMLEAAEKLRLKERTQEQKTIKLGTIVEKRKTSLIDYLTKKPPKKKKT